MPTPYTFRITLRRNYTKVRKFKLIGVLSQRISANLGFCSVFWFPMVTVSGKGFTIKIQKTILYPKPFQRGHDKNLFVFAVHICDYNHRIKDL
ncbi:hypothetical protein BH10BAC5_BH10BAC5_29390 [soil metagenome]